jgi:hypothetical protein
MSLPDVYLIDLAYFVTFIEVLSLRDAVVLLYSITHDEQYLM